MTNILILALILGSDTVSAASPSAKEIMTQNEEVRKIDDVQSSATLTTGGAGSAERVKKFTWWRKLTSDRVHFNTLTRFHEPAEIRGEGILFLEHGNNENEVLMYLPNLKKIRRVESQQQSGSFMGSELSYSDIATPHLEDSTYKLLQAQTCPGEGNSGIPCYVVEATPVSESVRDRTGYSKIVNWVRQDNSMIVKGEYYNIEGELWKKTETSDIQMVDPKKKKWMSHKIRVENVKNGRFTLLKFEKVKVNQGISDSVFTQQKLSSLSGRP
jgi:outer membrane lipoprotein-sorting protein